MGNNKCFLLVMWKSGEVYVGSSWTDSVKNMIVFFGANG